MDTRELTTTAVAAGGDAIARDDDGRVVFVTGALPGERVRATIVSSRRDYAKAVVVEIVEAAADRVAPTHRCGGCTWQHVSPAGQRRWKEAVVVDALRRLAHREDVMVTTSAGALDPPGRTTARLAAGPDGALGYRRPGSRDVVVDGVVGPCPNLAEPLRALVASSSAAPGDEVLLRVGLATGEHLRMVTGKRPSAGAVHEDVTGRRFRVSARSFFQSGPGAAGALVAAVTRAAAPAGEGALVDLYAGVGLFASVLGASDPRFDRVVAVEQDGSAVRDAVRNLADLEALVVEGEVGEWRPPADERAPAVVVADPARPGLGRPGVATVAATATPIVVLVSCDPASLARDVGLLQGAGYDLEGVELVDAFPDTFHIEAVSRFVARRSV